MPLNPLTVEHKCRNDAGRKKKTNPHMHTCSHTHTQTGDTNSHTHTHTHYYQLRGRSARTHAFLYCYYDRFQDCCSERCVCVFAGLVKCVFPA